MCLRLVVFLWCLESVYSCFGGGGGGDNETLVEYDGLDIMNPPAHLGAGPDSRDWGGVGWGRPQGAGASWGYGGKNPREPGPGEPGYVPPPPLDPRNPHLVPENWQGLGNGFAGAAPPQWAYLPKQVGKPTYCLLPPTKGPCKKRLTRYGFNPFVDRCQPFPYSGCGGNENNFKSRKRCDEECSRMPGPDCAPFVDPADGLPDDFYD